MIFVTFFQTAASKREIPPILQDLHLPHLHFILFVSISTERKQSASSLCFTDQYLLSEVASLVRPII